MKMTPRVPDSKVIILGNPGTGKTSIIMQYSSHTFSENAESTVAASYVSQKVLTSKGEVNLNIWDTAGQEKYRSLIPMYSRNAAAAILVFDLSSVESLNSKDTWIEVIKQHCPPNCRIYIVGNKSDLEPGFQISVLQAWADENEYPFFITTAHDRETIVPVFTKISEDLVNHPQTHTSQTITTTKVEEPTETCC